MPFPSIESTIYYVSSVFESDGTGNFFINYGVFAIVLHYETSQRRIPMGFHVELHRGGQTVRVVEIRDNRLCIRVRLYAKSRILCVCLRMCSCQLVVYALLKVVPREHRTTIVSSRSNLSRRGESLRSGGDHERPLLSLALYSPKRPQVTVQIRQRQHQRHIRGGVHRRVASRPRKCFL